MKNNEFQRKTLIDPTKVYQSFAKINNTPFDLSINQKLSIHPTELYSTSNKRKQHHHSEGRKVNKNSNSRSSRKQSFNANGYCSPLKNYKNDCQNSEPEQPSFVIKSFNNYHKNKLLQYKKYDLRNHINLINIGNDRFSVQHYNPFQEENTVNQDPKICNQSPSMYEIPNTPSPKNPTIKYGTQLSNKNIKKQSFTDSLNLINLNPYVNLNSSTPPLAAKYCKCNQNTNSTQHDIFQSNPFSYSSYRANSYSKGNSPIQAHQNLQKLEWEGSNKAKNENKTGSSEINSSNILVKIRQKQVANTKCEKIGTEELVDEKDNEELANQSLSEDKNKESVEFSFTYDKKIDLDQLMKASEPIERKCMGKSLDFRPKLKNIPGSKENSFSSDCKIKQILKKYIHKFSSSVIDNEMLQDKNMGIFISNIHIQQEKNCKTNFSPQTINHKSNMHSKIEEKLNSTKEAKKTEENVHITPNVYNLQAQCSEKDNGLLLKREKEDEEKEFSSTKTKNCSQFDFIKRNISSPLREIIELKLDSSNNSFNRNLVRLLYQAMSPKALQARLKRIESNSNSIYMKHKFESIKKHLLKNSETEYPNLKATEKECDFLKVNPINKTHPRNVQCTTPDPKKTRLGKEMDEQRQISKSVYKKCSNPQTKSIIHKIPPTYGRSHLNFPNIKHKKKKAVIEDIYPKISSFLSPKRVDYSGSPAKHENCSSLVPSINSSTANFSNALEIISSQDLEMTGTKIERKTNGKIINSKLLKSSDPFRQKNGRAGNDIEIKRSSGEGNSIVDILQHKRKLKRIYLHKKEGMSFPSHKRSKSNIDKTFLTKHEEKGKKYINVRINLDSFSTINSSKSNEDAGNQSKNIELKQEHIKLPNIPFLYPYSPTGHPSINPKASSSQVSPTSITSKPNSLNNCITQSRTQIYFHKRQSETKTKINLSPSSEYIKL